MNPLFISMVLGLNPLKMETTKQKLAIMRVYAHPGYFGLKEFSTDSEILLFDSDNSIVATCLKRKRFRFDLRLEVSKVNNGDMLHFAHRSRNLVIYTDKPARLYKLSSTFILIQNPESVEMKGVCKILLKICTSVLEQRKATICRIGKVIKTLEFLIASYKFKDSMRGVDFSEFRRIEKMFNGSTSFEDKVRMADDLRRATPMNYLPSSDNRSLDDSTDSIQKSYSLSIKRKGNSVDTSLNSNRARAKQESIPRLSESFAKTSETLNSFSPCPVHKLFKRQNAVNVPLEDDQVPGNLYNHNLCILNYQPLAKSAIFVEVKEVRGERYTSKCVQHVVAEAEMVADPENIQKYKEELERLANALTNHKGALTAALLREIVVLIFDLADLKSQAKLIDAIFESRIILYEKDDVGSFPMIYRVLRQIAAELGTSEKVLEYIDGVIKDQDKKVCKYSSTSNNTPQMAGMAYTIDIVTVYDCFTVITDSYDENQEYAIKYDDHRAVKFIVPTVGKRVRGSPYRVIFNLADENIRADQSFRINVYAKEYPESIAALTVPIPRL